MFDLVLGIKRSVSRRNDARAKEANKSFETVRREILLRDRMTCQGCGFSSVATNDRPSGGLEVHHIDDDHTNNKKENLVTLCPFCHMVFSLGRRGASFAGDLIWMPEVEQRDLNRLAHQVGFFSWVHGNFTSGEKHPDVVAWVNDAEQSKVFDSVYMKVMERWRLLQSVGKERIQRVFEDELSGFTKVEYLYSVLISLSAKNYEKRNKMMHGMRLVPKISHEGFQDLFAFWSLNIWIPKGKPTDWEKFLKKEVSRA
jgi:intracellular multiplication protein IcmJ